MHKHLVVSVGLLSVLACAQAQSAMEAWRQDGTAQRGGGSLQSTEQRQTDLRNALRAQRDRDNALDSIRGQRQLTAQERNELRQQLRQQRQDGIRK
jgi:hypothetical protein